MASVQTWQVKSRPHKTGSFNCTALFLTACFSVADCSPGGGALLSFFGSQTLCKFCVISPVMNFD